MSGQSEPPPNGVAVMVYSRREFARLVNRSEKTLSRWAKAGILTPSYYPSGRPFYTDVHLTSVLGDKPSEASSDLPDSGVPDNGTPTRNR
jgi:hypothetical protein